MHLLTYIMVFSGIQKPIQEGKQSGMQTVANLPSGLGLFKCIYHVVKCKRDRALFLPPLVPPSMTGAFIILTIYL